MSTSALNPFPAHGLLPKEETEAAAFIKKYPNYDGRGVIVAILDTGVDPGAAGLSTTTDGKPKIVDIVDCTGSGDVLMSELKEAVENHTIKGASGRSIKLNVNWVNPDGKYYVGMKAGYELFPKNLVSRLSEKRKERFQIEHEGLVAQVQAQIVSWEAKNGAKANDEQIREKANLDAQLEALKQAWTNYDDPGPIFDCVSFHDGKTWRAAIDTEEQGDLSQAKAFADYAIEHCYATFGVEDRLNYSLKFYDDGKTLSIVTNAGAHGTHVAAITAAHHPEDTVLNGVAPGCQLVSLKIGDSRLGSMETGTGLTRALNTIVSTGCHLCNMSYGEDAGLPNYGFWINLLRDELINKQQVIFVSSAGNAGPALSTVGAPGGSTAGVIGVGAYATAAMIKAEYALLEQVPDRPHTWSSRGPAYDGHKGVTIFAPGAAITSVPQYLLQNSQLMNGTSMSSPNACGNIALLLSALKAQSIPYTPYGIEKAVVNSAKDIKDELRVGFLQIEQAYDYYRKYHESIDVNLNFSIKVGNKNDRGVYLRELSETSRIFQANVSVNVEFRDDDLSLNDLKLKYEQRLVLISTAGWVRAPEFLLLNSGGRDFQIRVDPTLLPAGFSFAEVQAFDCSNAEKGMVFSIPVTVTKATVVEKSLDLKYQFTPGHIERTFVAVPEGAAWAELKLKAKGTPGAAKLVVHLLQMVPQLRHTLSEHHWYLNMDGDDALPSKKFKVEPGINMEVCTAQFWSSLGSYEVELCIEFHSAGLTSKELVLIGGEGIKRIDISSSLSAEIVTPSISFDKKRTIIRPTSSVLHPLMSRDILPNKKTIFELVLTYSLKLTETATITLRKPYVDNYLYDSYFDSALLMVHDIHKRMISFGDIYPKPLKLDKGEYTVRVQLRQSDFAGLEELKNSCILVDTKLDSGPSLSIYSRQPYVFDSAKKALSGKLKLEPGLQRPLFVDLRLKEIKNLKAGDLLLGEFKLGDTIEGGCTSVQYLVSPDPISPSANEDEKINDEKAFAEAVRDLKLDWSKKFSDKLDLQKKILDDLQKEFPADSSVNIQILDNLVAELKTDADWVQNLEKIETLVKKVIDGINEAKVVEFFGTMVPENGSGNTKEYKKQKKEFGDKKKALSSAYYRWCEALMHCVLAGNEKETYVSRLKVAFTKYESFSEVDLRFVYLSIARDRSEKRYGCALQTLNKFWTGNARSPITPPKSSISTFVQDSDDLSHHKRLYRLRSILLNQLDWSVWTSYVDQWFIRAFPSEHAPF